jgi:hypothetical protein
VVVYPSKWTGQIQTSLDNFVEWKRQIGWTVQTIGYPADTGEGADALKEYLQTQYDATAFTHLVLIGDYNIIPPYQHQGTDEFGRNAEKASGNTPILYTLCASDIPYAFLDGTDDQLYQDAFLSRLPVSTYAHINNLLSRLRIIEQGTTLASQSNPNWLTTGIFMGSNDSSSNPSNPYYGIKDKTIVAQACAKLQEAGIIASTTELYADKNTPIADDVIDAVTDAVDGTVSRVEAVDISFYDAVGMEIEPRLPVRVAMSSERAAQAETPLVVHVDDSGAAEVIEPIEQVEAEAAPVVLLGVPVAETGTGLAGGGAVIGVLHVLALGPVGGRHEGEVRGAHGGAQFAALLAVAEGDEARLHLHFELFEAVIQDDFFLLCAVLLRTLCCLLHNEI